MLRIWLVVALCVLGGAARAQDGIFSEVRLGVLAHDIKIAGGVEPGADINGELLFVSPVADGFGDSLPPWLRWVLHPRPHLGVDVNTAGATDQAYAGLTWTAILARGVLRPDDGVSFDLLFGPEVNNGAADSDHRDRKSLGSNILFHAGMELGYRFTPHLGAGVYFEHSSNGGVANRNESLNDLGLRVRYRF